MALVQLFYFNALTFGFLTLAVSLQVRTNSLVVEANGGLVTGKLNYNFCRQKKIKTKLKMLLFVVVFCLKNFA